MEVFNEKYDKIRMEELSTELQKIITESSDVVAYDLNKHIQDTKTHVSNLERETWNNKAPNESPNFTGAPTAPNPLVGDASNRIATTNFVNTTVRTYTPELSNKANKLANARKFSITGAAVSEGTVDFDGSKDIVIPIEYINSSAIKGTIPQNLLSGSYPISITGNANHAQTADTLNGVGLSGLLLKDSPIIEGKPTAPTAVFGTATDQLATTKFVDRAIKAIDYTEIQEKIQENIKFKPFTIKTVGKAISDEVTLNGENAVLTITSLNLDYNDISNNVNITRVNGHTVDKDVPADAKFTDTVYTHPNTQTDISNTEFISVTVDRQGHVIAGRNPSTLNVNVSKNAATASKLVAAHNIGITGLTATAASFDGSTDVNINVTEIPAALITEDDNHKFLTKAEKERVVTNGITADEVDAKINAVKVGMDWKESVNTVSDIETTYKNPQKGWTVNVNEDNTTYRYDGSKWVAISANAVPLASTTVDGKMSKEDKTKLDGIEANANNYVLPSTLPASMITEDENHKFLTGDQATKLSNLYTRSEMENTFVSKLELATTNSMSLGNGWQIVASEDGKLVFNFNGVEKASLGTDGLFKSVSIAEIGG